MEHIHYKKHLIITTVAFDAFNGRYIPTTAIACTKSDGTRHFALLDTRSIDQFRSCADTQRLALGAAKAWIDQHEDQ
jgi:hypothetical protein